MTAIDRRAFMAATAASVAAPTALSAKECPTIDWITMSLEARNLAYNNVEHVGPDMQLSDVFLAAEAKQFTP